MVGLAAALAFAAGTLLLAPRIDERYSAKTVLAALYRDPAMRERPVLMPFGDEYSAAFYAQALFGGRYEHTRKGGATLVKKRLIGAGDEVFLFERKSWSLLAPAVAARLATVAETPHWVAAEARCAPPSAAP